MAGVSFVDGDVSMNVNSTSNDGAGMQDGGPLVTPSDYAGRSSGMNVGNYGDTPQKGNQLDCPAEY